MLETNQDGLSAFHDFSDSQPFNSHSDDMCEVYGSADELSANEQLIFTSDEVHVRKDELTGLFPVADIPGQSLQNSAVPGNTITQADSPTSDHLYVDTTHTLLTSFADNAYKDEMRANFPGHLTSWQSLLETSEYQANYNNMHIEQVSVTTVPSSDITYENWMKSDTNFDLTETGLSETPSTGQTSSVDNDREGLASELCFISTNKSLIVHEAASSGNEISQESAHNIAMHDRWLAQAGIENTVSWVNNDPKIVCLEVDCENSRFADIPAEKKVHCIAVDCSEMEIACSSEEQVAQDQFSSLLSGILDKTENFGQGFSSAVEVQQIIDYLNAGISTSFGGMELSDDLELIPVEDETTSRWRNVNATEAVCSMKNDLDDTANITSLKHGTDCDYIYPSLGGTELSSDMELIPVENENTGKWHNIDGIGTMKTDIASETYYDDKEHLVQYSPETYTIEAISDNDEHLESADNDNNYEVLLQPLDLRSTPECISASNQMMNMQCDTIQEIWQRDLMLITADDVPNSENEHPEIKDPANENSKVSSAEVELVESATSVLSVAETKSAAMPLSLEMTRMSTTVPDMVELAVSNTENFKAAKNGKESDITNTNCISTADTGHKTCPELHSITAGLSGYSTVERSPDFPSPKLEEMRAVHYATEEFQFCFAKETEQLESFTIDNMCPQTERLELDNLTLTVTCFIPEENEDLLLDEDAMENMNNTDDSDFLSPSSDRFANSPVKGNDFVISADKTLPKRRSSEFMLSNLMPIDEAAEYVDDAITEIADMVPDEHTHELSDTAPKPSNSVERKMASDINTSPAVEHTSSLHHAQTKNMELCDDIPTTAGIEDRANLVSTMNNLGIAAYNGSKLNSCNGKEQLICEESHSSVEHPVENDGSGIEERNQPFQFSTNHWDQAVNANTSKSSECDLVTAIQDSELFYDNNACATSTKPDTITVESTLPAVSGGFTDSRGLMLLQFDVDETKHFSSTWSALKTAECSGDDHPLDIDVLKQNKLQGICDVMASTECKDENTESDMVVGLEVEASDHNTEISESSVAVHTDILTNQKQPWNQNAKCEKPVLQPNNIHAVLDAVMLGNEIAVNAEHPQQVEMQEHPLSYERSTSHGFASGLEDSVSVEVTAPLEVEELAVDAVTDFESTLEQLHSTLYTAESS